MSCKGKWKTLLTPALFVLLLPVIAGKASASQSLDFPITLTSQYARTERTYALTGEENVFTTMDNNITFNSSIPGTTRRGQQINMNFNRIESKALGRKSTADNIGFFISMSGKNYSLTNNFSMVENAASEGAKPEKNKGVNMSVALNWPRMPSVNIMLTSFEAGQQSTESGQFATSYRVGRTSLSFNNVETSVDSLTTPKSEGTNKSLSASRLHVSTKHLTISSNFNFNRQRSLSAGVQLSRAESDGYSMAIYDSHIKNVPLNLNLSLQKNKQLSGNLYSSQSARSINAFSSFALPLDVRADLSYNASTQRDAMAGAGSNSRVISFSANKQFTNRGVFTLSHTAQRSSSLTNAPPSENRSTIMTYSAPVFTSTFVSTQRGVSTVNNSGTHESTTFVSVNIQSTMRGGITTTYQYQTTKASTRSKNESMNIAVPVSPGVRFVIDASKRQTPEGRDNVLGIITSIAISPSTSLSTTFSRQMSSGRTTNRVWGLWITSTYPGRVTLSFGVSTQQNQDLKSLSTTLTLQSTF